MNFNNNTDYNLYENYINNKQIISNYFDQTIESIDFLNLSSLKESLLQNKNKLNTDTFKVLVIGSFKNGKSSFINALLGEEILPAYSTPCTAVINEIKYGEKPKAIMHFKSEVKDYEDSYLLKIPEYIRKHIESYSTEKIPPIEIPWDDLEDYVVIPVETENQERGIQESPYEKVELFYPLELLKNGIEIIDSPGINESETHTRIAQNYVRNADAVIFIFNALAPFTKAEQDFLEKEILNRGFNDIIYVVNRFDQLLNNEERAKVIDFANQKIVPLTSLKQKGLFYTSAQNGLEGKIEHNEEKYNSSGIKEFEIFLADFLINQKGILKLKQPVEELKKTISEQINNELSYQTQLIEVSVQDLIQKQNNIEPEITSLCLNKTDIENKLNNGIEKIKKSVLECVRDYYINIDSKLDSAINSYEASEKISLFQIKKQSELVGEDICKYLQGIIVNEQRIWAEKKFQPLLLELLSNWLKFVEKDLNDYYVKIDAIKISADNVKVSSPSIPLWQRALGVAAGAILGSWDIALLGGVGGLNIDLFKTIGLEIAATMALSLAGLLNPVTFLGVSIFAIVYNGLSVGKRIEKQLKQNILQEVKACIHEKEKSVTEILIQSCESEMVKIKSLIIDNMDNEIKILQDTLQNIIKEKEKGEQEAIEYKNKIENCNSNLLEILNKLECIFN